MKKVLVATTVVLSLLAFFLFNRTQKRDEQKLGNQTVPTVTPANSPTTTPTPTVTRPSKKLAQLLKFNLLQQNCQFSMVEISLVW